MIAEMSSLSDAHELQTHSVAEQGTKKCLHAFHSGAAAI